MNRRILTLSAAVAILTAGAAGMLCLESQAADPILAQITLGAYSSPITTLTRFAVNLNFKDDAGAAVYAPEKLTKVWAKYLTVGTTCGSSYTNTATVSLPNGATVVMKKDVDYTFMVPTVEQSLPFEISGARITTGAVLGSCLKFKTYGVDGWVIGTN